MLTKILRILNPENKILNLSITLRLKIREKCGEELTTKWVKNYLKPIHVHAVVYHRGCTWQGNRHDASNASIRQLYAWFRQKPTFCLVIQFLLKVGPICFLSVIREKKYNEIVFENHLSEHKLKVKSLELGY